MPLTLTDDEVKILKKAFRYLLISHRAYFENNVLFRAMKDSGDFEKVVVEPLKLLLKWTPEDDKEKEQMRIRLLEKAQMGKTPEEWYKNTLKALDKEFKISGKTIVVAGAGAVAAGAVLIIGGKLVRAFLSNGKNKKKTGE